MEKTLQINELALVCFFLARIFLSAPDQQSWQELQDIKNLKWMLSDADDEELKDFSKFQQSLNENLDNLAVDYAQLFIGPDILKVPPWASIYMDKEQIVFGEQSVYVQKFYEKYHMQWQNNTQEPSDHLALELQFIGTILTHLDQAEDEGTQQYILHDLGLFLQDHLLPWAPQCLEKVQQHAKTDFYKISAKLASGVIQRLQMLS